MKSLPALLVLMLLVFAAVPLKAQRRGSTPSTASGAGIPNPDSLRHYLQLLQRGDTSALERYQSRLGSVRRNPRVARLAVLARVDRDSVVLRWAPSKAGGWLVANKHGYIVERVSMDANGKAVISTLHRLTPAPIKPWTLEEWKRKAHPEDKYAAVAAQALYGKSFTPKAFDPGKGGTVENAVDELSGRFGFAMFAADNDPVAAEGLGVRLVDKDVRAGERYVYRVYLAGRDTSYAVDTAYAMATPAPYTPPPAPPGLTLEGRDGAIILRWNNPPAREGFSGYYIYRSADDGESYRQLNETPYVPLTAPAEKVPATPAYTDTDIVNYKVYRYRVRGIDAFAELGSAAEVRGFGRDLTPPAPPILKKPEQLSLHSVRLTWDEPVLAPDLAGFVVTKSAGSMSGYHLLGEKAPPAKTTKRGKTHLPPEQPQPTTQDLMRRLLPRSARSFVDTTATSDEPYYSVAAVDTAGNIASSLPSYAELIDTAAPSAPTGLAGRIDTNGVVTLHWNLGPERDIIGYRLYWANEATHEFSMRDQEMIKDTTYTDTVNLNTLSRSIFYKITSINARHHQSPMSRILALRRPDRVPPVTPVFTDVFVTDSSVSLTWAASPSEDVAREELYRRDSPNSRWVRLSSVAPHRGQYVDRDVKKNTMYEYQLVAIDSAGLHSPPSDAVQGRPYDTGVRPPVRDLLARFDQKTGHILLTWRYDTPLPRRYWFVVYRNAGGRGLMEYRSLDSTRHQLDDDALIGKGTYDYAVKVISEGGGQSLLSSPVTVVVR